MNRWFILFILFFARTVMAFQFQSVAALSPLLIDSFAVTLVEIGLLIGLYLGPGIIVAVVGGTLASLFGDRRTVFASILLMVVGAMIVGSASTLDWLLVGRVVSGIGGVVVNVVMTKMVIDWFAGRNIATAMAIFISSWPMGIALALVLLPWLAARGGLDLAWFCVTAATGIALVLFTLCYRTPEGLSARGKLNPVGLNWGALLAAAGVWAFYNSGVALVFGFGSIMLVAQGLSAVSASTATSLFMFAFVISTPIGGWLADRSGGRDVVIAISLGAGVVLFPTMPSLPLSYALIAFALAGVVVGLGAGSIFSLPSAVLSPEGRAFGMGVYFSIYYLLMMAAPPVAGAFAERLGQVDVTFVLASAMMAAALASLWVFRRSHRPKG